MVVIVVMAVVVKTVVAAINCVTFQTTQRTLTGHFGVSS